MATKATTKATAKATEPRYRIEHELGRGGMAVVHAATDDGLGRRVALKILAAHLAGDDAFRERFLREARIAGSLHHPNLVHVYDIVELDGLPCIVMELVDGTTLAGGTLSLEEAAQIADGVAYAHAQGIVHRDLKPGNLLRGEDGVVKITDFGIARAVEETRVTQIGTVLGTLRYLAPEQAEGREVGPAADVYSLGVVLDELLVGPPPEVRAILERCRERDPRRRPSAAHVASALRGETLPLTAVTWVRSRYLQRRWAPVAALAVVVAAAGIAIGLLAANRSSPSTPPAPVAQVARSTDASQQARNLVVWLQRYSAAG
jgi:eukaryotic-like serine/threonine-protein kinase